MIDVLVALLLLALALTGACATLVQTMHSTHSAFLATRAVDLAADITEQLHGVSSNTEANALVAAWRTRVSTELPVVGMEPEEFGSLTLLPQAEEPANPSDGVHHFELTLRWKDGRIGGNRELNLLVALPSGVTLP
jgi:hypothetical protein